MPSYSEIIQHATDLLRQGNTDDATALFEQVLKAVPGDPLALEFLGVQANKAGDHEKAVRLLTEAASHPRRRESVLFQLGHAHRDGGDFEAAAQCYEKYLTLKDDQGGRLSLADVYFSLNRLEEASQLLTTALSDSLEAQPEDLKALGLLAIAQDYLGHTTDANEIRRRILAINNQEEDSLMIKASAWFDMGHPEEAFRQIGAISNSLYGDSLINVCNGYNPAHATQVMPPVQGALPHASDTPLVFAVGDPDYMARFASDLVSSAAVHAPESQIHLHVVSTTPMDSSPDFGVPGPSVTISWECEPTATKVMYATRRFVRLSQWMRELSRPVVVVDLDSQIRSSVSLALSKLPAFDVAMYYREREIFLRQRIAAGFLALNPTPEAATFIDNVAAYILHFEQSGTSKWFVDQMALLAARSMAQTNTSAPPIRITDVPASYMDWRHFNSGSLVWTTKGAHKTLPPVA